MNEIKQKLGLKYFGTSDYNAALAVLAPSAVPVRRFYQELKILSQGEKS